MKITIEANPKEIAALAAELQERLGKGSMETVEETNARQTASNVPVAICTLSAEEVPGPIVGGGRFYSL